MRKTLYFLAALLAASCGPAQASPAFYSQSLQIALDNQWHSFDVDEALSDTGLQWINLDGDSIGFEFNLSSAAYLTVVDGGFAGDSFSVYDNGALLGHTSAAGDTYPDSVGLDFDTALSDERYSRGVFLLGPGLHSIYGWLQLSALDDVQEPINATVGALRLTAVPLPGAVWLFSAGLALSSTLARRRHTIGA